MGKLDWRGYRNIQLSLTVNTTLDVVKCQFVYTECRNKRSYVRNQKFQIYPLNCRVYTKHTSRRNGNCKSTQTLWDVCDICLGKITTPFQHILIFKCQFNFSTRSGPIHNLCIKFLQLYIF